jgi:GrpB-like predicted nucleotidyltransferase (UPF0157 family)
LGRRIEVVPYDPRWPAAFGREAEALRRVFGSGVEAIHHVGSTSVPGLTAKPVIDILVVVKETTERARCDDNLRALGYRVRGECLDAGGTPGRFYYCKPVEGARTHHLHVCRVGHFQILELIWFAQYLRENAEVAVEYTRLKTQAAAVNGHDNVQYMARKHDWIRATIRAALAHYGQPSLRIEHDAG